MLKKMRNRKTGKNNKKIAKFKNSGNQFWT